MECSTCHKAIPAESRFCLHCGAPQSAAAPAGQQTGGSFTDPLTGLAFVAIAGGGFRMGDLWEDGGRDEKPLHLVQVADFHLAGTPVTQAQWRRVMDHNPAASAGPGFVGDDKPVVNVSWEDAQTFIKRLNADGPHHYRLPAEAEWEYAARSGGKEQKWAGTSEEKLVDEFVWHSGNSGGQLQEVARKKPNDLGLYDMSGNVWEWCDDVWHPNYENAPRNAVPWLDSAGGLHPARRRVVRGGSWNFNARSARTTYRDWNDSDYRFFVLGLRLAI